VTGSNFSGIFRPSSERRRKSSRYSGWNSGWNSICPPWNSICPPTKRDET
jgi:hypothetical protein